MSTGQFKSDEQIKRESVERIDKISQDFEQITRTVANKLVPDIARKAVADCLEGLLPDALKLAVDEWQKAPLHVQLCVIRKGGSPDGETFDPTPVRKTPGSSGYDLRYCPAAGVKVIDLRPTGSLANPGFSVDAKGVITIYTGSTVLLPTGIAVAIPANFEAQVRPRSGLSCQGFTIGNSPGTVDSDYRTVELARTSLGVKPEIGPAEIKVLLRWNGATPEVIKPGDRIAQLVFAEVQTADFELVEPSDWQHTTERKGGFGSTGSV